MKKNLLMLFIIFFITSTQVFCNEINQKEKAQQMHLYIGQRLKLDENQKAQLRINHLEHKKQMEEIVFKMEELKEKINEIYCEENNANKLELELKVAPYKTELVLLRNQAKKLKEENRKKFINALTEEQKIEYKKIRQELKENKIHCNCHQ